jgi:branched-chain amino acid transport system ATP-binding protein
VRDRVVGRQEPALAEPAAPDVAPTGDPGFLSVRGVDAGYGPVQILFGADLDVEDGEMLALLGTNGAGKSTLLRVIAGLLPTRAGRVAIGGAALTGDAAARARAGVALMPGGKAVFPSLTVAENLRLGRWLHPDDEATLDEVLALFPALAERPEIRAGLMSGGQQQMLGLALAMLCRPRLLLIDELSLGLAPSVVAQLLEAVRLINARGTTVVIVEQSLNVAATVAQQAVFLERGTVRYRGPTADLLDRDDLARAVFLTPPVSRRRHRAVEGETLLEVADLGVRFGGIQAVAGVDLTAHRREVVGIIGSNGAGKTTLLDAVSGFVPASGTVTFDGVDVSGRRPADRATLGLGRSFQGARLFASLTVTETLAVACDRHIDVREPFACALRLAATRRSEAAVHARVAELLESVGLTRYADRRISELSTGTRRIVELACAIAHQPSVLLLDEPSSGLAQRETESLAGVLDDLRHTLDAAFVIVEHDIGLISGLADRLVCMDRGTVLATGSPRDVLDDPAVVASYLGADRGSTTSVNGRPAGNGDTVSRRPAGAAATRRQRRS